MPEKPSYEELEQRVKGLEQEGVERKRVEEALKKDRATLDNIIKLNPYSISLYDANGHYITGNQAYLDLFGGTPPPPEYSIFDDPIMKREGLHELILELKEGKVIKPPFEVWYNPHEVRPDLPDKNVCASCVCFPIVDPDGNVENIVVMHEDVTEHKRMEEELRKHRDHLEELVKERTAELIQANEQLQVEINERKRAEEAFRESERRFRRLVEHATDAFFLHDFDGRMIDVNEHACESLGYTREELLALSIKDIDLDFFPGKHLIKWEQLVPGEPTTFEGVHRRKDGTTFPVEVRLGAFEPDERRLMLGLVRDISERKKAEEALHQRTHDLGERVKELNCLFNISYLVEKPGISLEEILQGITDLVPPSWQYPDITCARLILEDQTFMTNTFNETAWKQTSDIIVHGEVIGALEVFYLEEKPERDEGPFLKEERSLINSIAERLGRIIEHKRAEEALLRSEERFRRVIENIFKFVPEGLLTFSDKLNLFRTNKAFQDIVQKYSAKLNYTDKELTEIIIEQIKNRIISEDYAEIRIPKNKDKEAKNR